MVELLKNIYHWLFPPWTDRLKKELSDCNSVLDLGCGSNSPLEHCNVPFSIGVELFSPYLQQSKSKCIHNQYIRADVRTIELKPKSFDAVIAIELLEHLRKQEGHQLLNKMEILARKRIIITVPNGYLWQNGYDDNPLQKHKSDWSATELRSLGFTVHGIGGWKNLIGYKGSTKYRPAFLGAIISDLTQKLTYRYPKLAFQLLAIKQIEDHDRECNI